MGLLIALMAAIASGATTPTPVSIAQVPLTVAIPGHPQIVVAIGNSESMDGDLSGAIMTGSGALSSSYNLLQASSSPVNYAVPAGYTPPVNPGSAGQAPYTATSGSELVDNSASRLNVAKASIAAMLSAYMANADFALLDYSTSSLTEYTTWVYQMSPSTSGFTFTSSQLTGDRYATNPCYNYTSLTTTNTIYQDCHAIDTSGNVTGSVATSLYMQIGASSDDPEINDVLYAGSGSIAPVCLVYGGPNPANPYTSYTLGQYNSNPAAISETYSHEINGCATETTPTNAGYVPYTPQTMYVERGFGYGASQSATAASTLVAMTTAGATPTASTVATAIAKFTPYLQPETNSTSTTEIKASAGQSALPGLLKGANTYYTSKNPPSSNGCPAKRYVILLTDGLPTLDLSGHSWPPPGTTSATSWGETVAFNSDGSLNTAGTNDQAVIDTINQLAALNSGSSPVKTYVIGLGAGVDPTQNPTAANVLKAMAIAGGTGNYYAATSPTALTNDLQGIIVSILTATQSTASATVNSTPLNEGSVAYEAQFTTSDVYQDWTGDLLEYPINPTTGAVNTATGAQIWSAKVQLDAQSSTARVIATWDPVATAGTPFEWNPAAAPAGISATTALGAALSTFTPDTSGSDVLSYLRGNSTLEQRNGGTFRNRAHKLGDIVSSAPLYVGAPSSVSQASSYFTFATAHANRKPIVYVGANDGMLHAFDAATGNERFAYVPNGVFSNLVNLVNPYYNANHLYYVNGSPTAADVQFASDSSWHTVLAGTEGAGGKSVFALDITNADTISSEAQLSTAVLWEFTDTDMGLSFSQPQIADTNAGWLVLFGNGYNSSNQKPILYAVDPQKGTMIAKVDLCAAKPTACNTSLANGLSSIAVVPTQGSVTGTDNMVYAGDLQGNVWRIDISNSNPTLWAVSVLYQTRDASGNIQPITTAPAVSLNPEFPQLPGTIVAVGTGQLLGFPDLATTGVQTLYGLFDAPTGSGSPLGFNGIPTRANLAQQTVATSTVTDSSGPISVLVEPTVNPVNLPTQRGWYLDFSVAPGFRFVTNPQIEAGGILVVIAYQPNSSPCTSGGNSWLLALNYATGGSFPAPILDVTNSGQLNSSNQTASGQNPVGLYLQGVYASEPTIVQKGSCAGTDCGAKETQLSNGTIPQLSEQGGVTQRNAWWEVRQ